MLNWDEYSKVANQFKYKVRFQDREDLKQQIILELAQIEVKYKENGKVLSCSGMVRAASYIVADYWRKELKQLKAINVYNQEEKQNDQIYFIETIADDKAVNVIDWINARRWICHLPARLLKIACKRVVGYSLTTAERTYLNRHRYQDHSLIKSASNISTSKLHHLENSV